MDAVCGLVRNPAQSLFAYLIITGLPASLIQHTFLIRLKIGFARNMELRNKMMRETKGMLAGGRPPYLPAELKISEHLMKPGLVTAEEKRGKCKNTQARLFPYRSAGDPAWKPEEIHPQRDGR